MLRVKFYKSYAFLFLNGFFANGIVALIIVNKKRPCQLQLFCHFSVVDMHVYKSQISGTHIFLSLERRRGMTLQCCLYCLFTLVFASQEEPDLERSKIRIFRHTYLLLFIFSWCNSRKQHVCGFVLKCIQPPHFIFYDNLLLALMWN